LQVWTLNIWWWLILYPSVTRKALSTFDCVELQGKLYLRADAAVVCYESEWLGMALLAAIGTATSCLVAPAAIVVCTSRYHFHPSKRRCAGARVALQTPTHTPSHSLHTPLQPLTSPFRRTASRC